MKWDAVVDEWTHKFGRHACTGWCGKENMAIFDRSQRVTSMTKDCRTGVARKRFEYRIGIVADHTDHGATSILLECFAYRADLVKYLGKHGRVNKAGGTGQVGDERLGHSMMCRYCDYRWPRGHVACCEGEWRARQEAKPGRPHQRPATRYRGHVMVASRDCPTATATRLQGPRR